LPISRPPNTRVQEALTAESAGNAEEEEELVLKKQNQFNAEHAENAEAKQESKATE